MALPGRGRAWAWDSGPAPHPGGATVVLLHGWTSTAALNWHRCFRPLARRHRVVAMDHRGHGRGIRSPKPFTLEDCADDVAALVDLLGTGPVVVAGYSMGGPIAQLLWRRHPEVVRGLVLCATSTRFGDVRLPGRATQAVGVGLSLALAAVPTPVLEQVRRRLGLAPDTTGMAAWAVAESGYGDPISYVQAGAAVAAFDARRWITEVDVPTAVIVTGRDPLVPPLRQMAMAEAIPGAAVLTVDADHHACVQDAGRFVPALLDAVDLVSA